MTGRLAGTPVDGVLFDYGHTLVTCERPEPALVDAYGVIAHRLSEDLPGRPAIGSDLVRRVHRRVEARVDGHALSARLDEIDTVALTAEAYVQAGVSLTPSMVDEALAIEQEAWWTAMVVGPGVVTVLGALRAAGIRTGLCSNASYRPESLHGQLAHLGLDDLLDSVTFSSEVGWRKPSPRIFEAAVAALGCPVDTTVMLGDRVRQDVLGARAMGMRAIRLREHVDDVDDEQLATATLDRLSDLPDALGLAPARSPDG
jgi:putative hydrolase of the HAD superfamily